MKMYGADLSPYASRVRMQAYAKGIELEQVEPPGGLSSDAYKQLNPTGKIPALDVEGRVIPESEVICEYLEERFPTPALLPADALERSRSRTLSRSTDLYLLPALFALVPQMDPKTRDQAEVDARLGELGQGLDVIERHLDDSGYAVGDSLSIADCALVPALFFITRMVPATFGLDPLQGRAKASGWWERVQSNEHAQRVIDELTKAMQERFGGGS
ncbi:MAG: glutathione S-transferase family protein [Myxococcota bacterium]